MQDATAAAADPAPAAATEPAAAAAAKPTAAASGGEPVVNATGEWEEMVEIPACKASHSFLHCQT